MTPSVMTPSMTPPMAPSRVPSIASSMSHTPTTQHAIVVSDDDQDDMIQIIATHRSSQIPEFQTPMRPSCPGLHIEFPPGQTPFKSYPFVMHDANVLCWDVEICQNLLYLRSLTCTHMFDSNQEACRACKKLLDDKKLQGIRERIEKGMMPSTPHQYWSWGILHRSLLHTQK